MAIKLNGPTRRRQTSSESDRLTPVKKQQGQRYLESQDQWLFTHWFLAFGID
ncbi:hypothetical protein [Methylobacter sp. BlB1]|uniref:hypothetical protein n=1 Tax=Methylobacter sp. BlB1 TaxID=2785914 RepID=UPI001895480D|nr:hypothetical protein [Methylobacter sp. BlB1]MBF6650509.1 hypothetical protein [Methylobacter sp. BlB1]